MNTDLSGNEASPTTVTPEARRYGTNPWISPSAPLQLRHVGLEITIRIREFMKQGIEKLWKRVARRENFKYFLLGLPGSLMPQSSGMSLHGSWYSIGLLLPAPLQISNQSRPLIDSFEARIIFLLNVTVWAGVAYTGCLIRRKAAEQGGWFGASVQALLTMMYALLCFCFLIMATKFLWNLCLHSASASTLERAFDIAIRIVPTACVIAALSSLLGIWIDSRNWSGRYRLPYVIAAMIAATLLGLSAFVLHFEIEGLKEMRRIIHNENSAAQKAQPCSVVESDPAAASRPLK